MAGRIDTRASPLLFSPFEQEMPLGRRGWAGRALSEVRASHPLCRFATSPPQGGDGKWGASIVPLRGRCSLG